MQLLHVLAVLAAGGAERFVAGLVPELRRLGFDVGLISVSRRFDAVGRQMAAELEGAGVPLRVGPTDEIRLRSICWYARVMRELRPEIVHLHTPNTEVLQLFVPPGRQPLRGVVRTVHSTELQTRDMDRFALRENAVAASIFCSEASRQSNRAWVRGPVRVIPSGVALDRPARTPERSREAKARLGLDPTRIHFLQVGRMWEGTLTTSPKAHDVVIRAWRESGVAADGGILHLLGDGGFRPQLVALAANDPSILFHGVRADVAEWLIAADCFVMPSRYEGLPVAGVEAVTAGLPCLFTRIRPLEELEAPLALWSDVDDVAGLARNMAEIARTRPSVDPAAVERVREVFGIGRVAARYAEVYRELGLSPGGSDRDASARSRSPAR